MLLKWILIILLISSTLYSIWYYRLKKKAEAMADLAAKEPTQKWSEEFLNSKRQLTAP